MYKTWEELIVSGENELLNTRMHFSSMIRGEMLYVGQSDGEEVICTVSEDSIRDYEFNNSEYIKLLTQSRFVRLHIGGKTIMNTF